MSTALVFALASLMTGQAPEPSSGVAAVAPSQPSSARKAELEKAIANRKARAARMARDRAIRERQTRADEQAAREQQLRMAPILAERARLEIQAQQAAGIAAMGAAAQQNAAINYRNYVLQTQRAGIPQVLLPDGTLGPYPYAVAAPR